MNTKYALLAIGILLLVVQAATAVPTASAATLIGSNNFTTTVAGSDGGNVRIIFGGASGNLMWSSQIETGDGTWTVYGAPLIGGETVYYKACDSTGCSVLERSCTLAAVTIVPTPTFGNAYKNMTYRHFSLDSIAPNILPGYTATGMPTNLLWGIMFMFVLFGFWFRTKSIRMVLIMGIMMATFILSPTVGLMMGAPLVFQLVAQGLIAAAIAGLLITLIRK